MKWALNLQNDPSKEDHMILRGMGGRVWQFMLSQNIIYFQSFAGDNIYFHPTSAQTIYFKI